MDKLNPDMKKALFAIQKEILMNISIHQFLVTKLRDCQDQEHEKSVVIETRKEYENRIKALDQKQKKLLAVIRNNNLAKSNVNQGKEETAPESKTLPSRSPYVSPPRSPRSSQPKLRQKSPQKLIDYPAKRPRDEEFCPEPFKRKKSHKKGLSFPAKEKVEQDSSNLRENCLSKEEEDKLIAHGCFYVFSQQTKLTRPLTEQDYFLMNFGLVSRDHIQYAPFDVACNVRRTRRLCRSRYGASEWETTYQTTKKIKLAKDAAARNIFVEERSVKTKGKGKEVIPSSPGRRRLLSSSSSVDSSPTKKEICGDETFYGDNNLNFNPSQTCSSSLKAAASCKIIKSDNSGNKENNSDSTAKLNVDTKVDDQSFQLPKAEITPLSLSQKIEPVTDEKKPRKEESRKWSLEYNMNSKNSPELFNKPKVNMKVEVEDKFTAEKLAQEKTENCFPEEKVRKESKKECKVCNKPTDYGDLKISEVCNTAMVSGVIQCDNPEKNTNLASENEGISSQDSGISMRSNASDSCPSVVYPSFSSQELTVDNDLSDESTSLECDLILPGVFREQVNTV